KRDEGNLGSSARIPGVEIQVGGLGRAQRQGKLVLVRSHLAPACLDRLEHGRARWHVCRRGCQLRVHHGAGDHYPQYAALHLDSSYLRLADGPASGWGTSVILLPSFWSGGRLQQGAPVSAAWRAD